MQTRNPMLDDLARVASGAMTTLGGVREEIENRVKERLERFAAEMELVTREEYDAVKAMAVKAREEQAELQAYVAQLEKRIEALEAAPKEDAKPAVKRKTKADDETGEG
ncbi:MAG: accessory factor UbiK family protein [Geminicoccaceae bacterium]|nr:MAG: accessory factor UbiK family protein [Geminicoccaceae bacterium]